MGSIYNRGTRSKPNWYVSYKDLDGSRKTVSSKQPTKALARRFLEQIESRIAAGQVGIVRSSSSPTCQDLMAQWAAGLRNRNANDDRSRMRRALFEPFGGLRLADVTMASVMTWIDDQRDEGRLSEASIRHNLNLLSRFFSWAIERGFTDVNPVRQIPTGKRPQQSVKTDVPWLNDDTIVRTIIAELIEPINYMFYLGNRSGLRTGELAGLRLSDFGFLDEGVIRVRYSYAGPLKEDKNGRGKVKWAPAPEDCPAFMGSWISARKAQGAGPEDFLFPGPKDPSKPCRKEYIEGRWERVRDKLELGLTWYQATRHSFVSRLLEAGASLDEVSSAVGHSSPIVTRRYYDHFIRRSFSDKLRTGLGLGGDEDAKVVAIRSDK